MTNKGHHLCHPGKIRYLLSHEVDAGQSIVHRLHQGMSTNHVNSRYGSRTQGSATTKMAYEI